MATRTQHHFKLGLRSLWLALALAGCTDGRIPATLPVQINQRLPPQNVIPAGVIRFDDNDTRVVQLQMNGTILYASGYPFGFMRMNLGANPEQPQLDYAVRDHVNSFPIAANASWQIDQWASGAINIFGPVAFMSGTVGLDAVDITNSASLYEAARFPAFDSNATAPTPDTAFIYRALVSNPNGGTMYGFSQQDYVYTLGVNGHNVQLVRKDAYGQPGQSVCCVTSATLFNNLIFVAFGSKLVIFQPGTDGTLTNPQVYGPLQATYVASSQNYLYVQHHASYAYPQGQNYSDGVYVFDAKGTEVSYIQQTARLFQVTPDDRYMYANTDDKTLAILRLQNIGAPSAPAATPH